VEKERNEWNWKNNNSLEWNEWAMRNLTEARDICLEAEFFYGEGNILPINWAPVIEKWDKEAKGNIVIDDESYHPKINDEVETGPIRVLRLGYKDRILKLISNSQNM